MVRRHRRQVPSRLILQRNQQRRALPAHLPRMSQTHQPKSTTCPDCGGELRELGEDLSEMLDYLPANFVVLRHRGPKLSCGHCGRIVQAPAPSRPIAVGVAGPGLLAHVLVSKYCDPSSALSTV
jgi:transposase